MEKLNLNVQEHVKLYQSNFFKDKFPLDNNRFKNVIITEDMGGRELSIQRLRERIFTENKFDAAVFIGGMEGVEEEFNMLRVYHPSALILPIASTGAAAKIIYDNLLPAELKDKKLLNDYGYMELFQSSLIEKI